MQDQPIHGRRDCGNSSTTEAQDLHDQGVVLIQVLALHPACLTISELAREITGGSCDFEPEDRYERAIRDLTGAGLLNACAGFVMPSRAALAFDQLLGG
jgi:hypothetical protein